VSSEVPLSEAGALGSDERKLLVCSAAIISICALSYELIISSLSSYYFGNAVSHFSITIGLFMTFMGVGSWLSKKFENNLLDTFILTELFVGLVGGFSALILIASFSWTEHFYLVFTVLIGLISTAIGLEVPLLTRLVSEDGNLKDTLSNVLALDYLGALIASLLFPFLLLPYLGLLQTCFLMGVLNLGVALYLCYYFRGQLADYRKTKYFALTSMSFVLGGLIFSTSITSFFDRVFYQDEIILSKQTKYQKIVITRFKDDLRLYLNGNLQFSSHDEHRYHESLVHPALDSAPNLESVLILGGGDGLALREVLKNDKVKRVTLVDLDPEMLRLARENPILTAINKSSFSDPRAEVHSEDAYSFVEKLRDKFSVVLVDLPDPNSLELGKLYSKEFYRILSKNALARDGIIVTQSTSPYFARKAFWSINQTLSSEFAFVVPYRVYLPTLGVWGFNMASRVDLEAKVEEHDFLTPDLFDSFKIFDRDIGRLAVEANSLQNQVLIQYYDQGWREWH